MIADGVIVDGLVAESHDDAGPPRVIGVATPDGTITRALAVNAALGFERLVIVQATIYKNDHSLMFDVLSALPSDTVRGVAVLETAPDPQSSQRSNTPD